MALRKPVIATEGGGTKEHVRDGVTGFLIPHQAGEELENKILQLSENVMLRMQMGCNGKDRIQKNFSIEKMVRGHLNMYESLMTGNSKA